MTVEITNLQRKEDAIEIAFNTTKKHFSNISSYSKIIIKPNICAPKPPHTAVTTHHEIIIGVLEALKNCKNIMIVESHTTSSTFEENIEGWGYSFLNYYPNVELINLSDEQTCSETIKGLYCKHQIDIATILYDYDILINIPVMKTHVHTGVSMGMKNLFGLLSAKKKSQFHMEIHDLIFGLTRRFTPNLTILDAIQGMEGMGPIFGEPANAKLMLSSHNVIQLDAIGAKIMGFDQNNIRYLKEAFQYDAGFSDISEIPIKGTISHLNFKKVQTLPLQIVRAFLSGNVITLEDLKEQISAPAQTLENLSFFMEVLASRDIIGVDGKILKLKKDGLGRLLELFPEISTAFLEFVQMERFNESCVSAISG